jgi:hypothetical protein
MRIARRDAYGPYAPGTAAGSTSAARTNAGRPSLVERHHARVLLAPQRAVVRRQHRLDELGLAQQRAELAGGRLDLDAPDLGGQPRVALLLPVGAEVRGDALAQVHALADVERQRVVAVEQVDAGRLGDASSASGGSCGGRLGMRNSRLTAASMSAAGRVAYSCCTNSHSARASPSARWRSPGSSPWRAITASRPWPSASGSSRRDSRTVHSTRGENGTPTRANACLRKPKSKRALCATNRQPSRRARPRARPTGRSGPRAPSRR